MSDDLPRCDWHEMLLTFLSYSNDFWVAIITDQMGQRYTVDGSHHLILMGCQKCGEGGGEGGGNFVWPRGGIFFQNSFFNLFLATPNTNYFIYKHAGFNDLFSTHAAGLT